MAARRIDETSGPPGDAEDPLAGTPYRSVGKLGRGGMGEVFEAEHRGLNKRVVVKLLHRELAHDERFADRLRLEAQALAAVSSPHVVAVTDLGRTPAGRAYLVMERLYGRTLREELALRGPLPVGEAIGIGRQVLAGLAAAHRVGLVHRDVKLDNVFLCAPEKGAAPLVKVLDFGVAKVLPREASPPPVAGLQCPTEQGMLVGSPRTVSPEQARFQAVDARADLYAVGLLLYSLLVGHGPFDHVEHVLDLLDAHVRQVPAPPSRHAGLAIPPELDRAILKALAKRPEHRFQSAELFAEELQRIAASVEAATGPLPAASGRATSTERLPPGVEATAQGTLVLRPPAPEASPGPVPPPPGGVREPAPPSGGGGPTWNPEVAAWFASLPGFTPVTELPANLAAAARRAPGDVRLFVLLTLASTVVFSLLAALLLRWLGG